MVEGSPQSAAFSAVMAELGTALREAIPGAELSFDAAARPCYEHRYEKTWAVGLAGGGVACRQTDLTQRRQRRGPFTSLLCAHLYCHTTWDRSSTS